MKKDKSITSSFRILKSAASDENDEKTIDFSKIAQGMEDEKKLDGKYRQRLALFELTYLSIQALQLQESKMINYAVQILKNSNSISQFNKEPWLLEQLLVTESDDKPNPFIKIAALRV